MMKRMKRIFLGLFLAGILLMPITFGHSLAVTTTRTLADGGAPPPPPPWPMTSGQSLPA